MFVSDIYSVYIYLGAGRKLFVCRRQIQLNYNLWFAALITSQAHEVSDGFIDTSKICKNK